MPRRCCLDAVSPMFSHSLTGGGRKTTSTAKGGDGSSRQFSHSLTGGGRKTTSTAKGGDGGSRQWSGEIDDYDKISVAKPKALALLGSPGSGDSGRSIHSKSRSTVIGLNTLKKRFHPFRHQYRGSNIDSEGGQRGKSRSLSAPNARHGHYHMASKAENVVIPEPSLFRHKRRGDVDLTQLLFETDFEHVVLWEKAKDWASSIKRIDPRSIPRFQYRFRGRSTWQISFVVGTKCAPWTLSYGQQSRKCGHSRTLSLPPQAPWRRGSDAAPVRD